MISKAVFKSVKALKLKKYRSKEGKFLIEGLKNVNELIHANWKIDLILATEKSAKLISPHANLHIVDKGTLQSLSQLVNNEDCLAVAHIPTDAARKSIKTDEPIVALDGLQDPGNLGTIIRTLDWFGFSQIICSSDTVDFYNAKTILASMGSFTRVTPYYLDLADFLSSVHLPVYGLFMEGEPLGETKMEIPAVFVLGNESNGIRAEVQPYISQKLTITGKGRAESLNVGVSAGILIHYLTKT